MRSSISSSPSLFSSDNDLQGDSSDLQEERPFINSYEFSSDIVMDCGIDVNPFDDTPVKFNKQKENHWTCTDTANSTKSISMPVTTSRCITDFYDNTYNGESHSLPTLGTGKCDSMQRLSSDVLSELIRGQYNIEYTIIDCRFSAEFRGGHIRNAVNISSSHKVKSLFVKPRCLIFHCEFSSIRAPSLAQYVRSIDRKNNQYPNLTLPEMYVLEGGYKEFYYKYPELCTPKGYVRMRDVDHKIRRRKGF